MTQEQSCAKGATPGEDKRRAAAAAQLRAGSYRLRSNGWQQEPQLIAQLLAETLRDTERGRVDRRSRETER